MKKDNRFIIDRDRLGDEDCMLKINCLSESGGRKYSNRCIAYELFFNYPQHFTRCIGQA